MKKNTLRDEIDSRLFLQFRKRDKSFDDLLCERDKIIRIIEIHSITVDALKTELKRWDRDIIKAFGKLANQKIKDSEKKRKHYD